MNSSSPYSTPPSAGDPVAAQPNKQPRIIIRFGVASFNSGSDNKASLSVPGPNYRGDHKIGIGTETLPVLSSTPRTPTDSHNCRLCPKVFHSHQALGGHMTCHRRKPPITANDGEIIAASPATAISDVVSYTSDGSCSTASVEKVHECYACGEKFPTGQKLGGHKRKHYEGATGKNRGGAKRRLLDFFNDARRGDIGSNSAAVSHGGDGGAMLPVDLDLDLDLKLSLLRGFF